MVSQIPAAADILEQVRADAQGLGLVPTPHPQG